MTDKYKNFRDLEQHARLGRDFVVQARKRSGKAVCIAPHGGKIEPGTSEIAQAIAGDDFSFYAFEGIRLNRNRELHITSTRFDEPSCLALVKTSPTAIAVHGEDSDREVVFLGGLDGPLLKRLGKSLVAKGFSVEQHANPNLQGRDAANICNRNATGRGVQIELSKGLRRSFFKSLSTKGRRIRTKRFKEFVSAVRNGL